MSEAIQTYQRVMDQQRRDELILSHLPLVKHVIGRLVGELPPGVDVENLEQAGVLGLVEAAGRFDPTRDAQFKTFAYLRIRGAILDELRRASPLPQHMLERVSRLRKAHRDLPAPVTVEALAEATGMTLDEVSDTLAADRFAKMLSWEQTAQPSGLTPMELVEPPHSAIERWETLQQLTEAVEALPERERLAITLYFRDDLRLREMEKVMKLSQSRISRLMSRGLFTLGEALRAKNITAGALTA